MTAPTSAVVLAEVEGGRSEEEAAENTEAGVEDYPSSSGGWWKMVAGVVIGVVVAMGAMAFLNRRRTNDKSDLLR